MVNEQLRDYIKKEEAEGYTADQLREHLLSLGYSSDDVEEAIRYVSGKGSPQPSPSSAGTAAVSGSGAASSSTTAPIIVGIVILAVLGAGVFFYISSGTPEVGAASKGLDLGIESPKTNYEMGEPVQGNYVLDYSGEPFQAIVLYTMTREGYDEEIQHTSSGNIDMIPKISFSAFSIDENGHVADTGYFLDEGIYLYNIAVYDCNDLMVDCAEAEPEDLEGIEPLDEADLVITVAGGTSPSECVRSEDCTEICEGCRSGKEMCEMTKQRCMQCFNDFQCTDGYKCRDDKCVAWECDDNAGCNDNDASTKDTCSEFKCHHAAITECIDRDFYCPETCDETTDFDCGESTGGEMIDCGTSQLPNQCWLDAAKDCRSAKIVLDSEIEMFGMIVKSKSTYEIQGVENERCVVFQRIDENEYIFPDETIQQLLDAGTTQAEIDAQLAQMNEQALLTVGKDSTCRYPIEDLVSKIEQEMQGSISFSTDDLVKYECTGSLYEIGLP